MFINRAVIIPNPSDDKTLYFVGQRELDGIKDTTSMAVFSFSSEISQESNIIAKATIIDEEFSKGIFQVISWSYFYINKTMVIKFYGLIMHSNLQDLIPLENRIITATKIIGRVNDYDPLENFYVSNILEKNKIDSQIEVNMKNMEVFKMYSKFSVDNIEVNDNFKGSVTELLFEDVTTLELFRLENEIIISHITLYKPSYFEASSCSITQDYVICSARMEVGVEG